MKTSKLWLRNTSRYPDIEVWPLIKCAYESVERSVGTGRIMPRIIVKLTNCVDCYRGRAPWTEWHREKTGAAYEPRVEWRRILVRIGAPNRFPVNVRYPRFKGDMPEYRCDNYREGIVLVAAHEMEHCLGATGRKHGEFRCELTAWDAIDYYRKHQDSVDGAISMAMIDQNNRKVLKEQKALAAKNPLNVMEKKLAAARKAVAKWTRKQKLANTKLRQYQRAVKRLERKNTELMNNLNEPAALAALSERSS